MDRVIEMDMTSLQSSEAVRKKICQLENRQKIFLNRKVDAERKARTHRLIERGTILESIFPEIIPMSGERVKTSLRAFQHSNGDTG